MIQVFKPCMLGEKGGIITDDSVTRRYIKRRITYRPFWIGVISSCETGPNRQYKDEIFTWSVNSNTWNGFRDFGRLNAYIMICVYSEFVIINKCWRGIGGSNVFKSLNLRVTQIFREEFGLWPFCLLQSRQTGQILKLSNPTFWGNWVSSGTTTTLSFILTPFEKKLGLYRRLMTNTMPMALSKRVVIAVR